MQDPRDIERINPESDAGVNTNTNTPPTTEEEASSVDAVKGAVVNTPAETEQKKQFPGPAHSEACAPVKGGKDAV